MAGTARRSRRSRVVVWLVAAVCGVLTVGLAALVAVVDLDTAALVGGLVGTVAALASTLVAVLALVRSPDGAGATRPPARTSGRVDPEPGEVRNSITGGTQLGPVYQGRDFSFGVPPQQPSGPAAPRQDPGAPEGRTPPGRN